MHRQLKSLLPAAKGESHLVVVVFLDVRGFSSFAKIAESTETALFLRSAYVRVLEDFFPDASFFKPTGDGLLIVLDYDSDNLHKTVNSAIESSVRLVNEFPGITSGDPMINFDVPDAIGIGLARGAATALISGDKVLDYSGRPLNLAARLMDLARPRGVVFSSSLDANLLDEKHASQFVAEEVYVKGIAEDEPMKVYIMRDLVELSPADKRPLNKYTWKDTETTELKLSEVRARRPIYQHILPVEPALTNDIRVLVSHPAMLASGRRHPHLWTTYTIPAEYSESRGLKYADVDYGKIVTLLEKSGIKSTWPIRITIEYAVQPVV